MIADQYKAPPQPQSTESERAVLASILLDASANLPYIAGRLVDEDFFAERHQLIYRVMLDLQALGTEIDIRTVQAELEQPCTRCTDWRSRVSSITRN